MSALINLKLFLEKNKTDFYTGNPDLLDWFQDRGLKIEDLGQFETAEEKKYKTVANSVESKVVEEFNHIKKGKIPLESKISFEEFEAIFEKLIDLISEFKDLKEYSIFGNSNNLFLF